VKRRQEFADDRHGPRRTAGVPVLTLEMRLNAAGLSGALVRDALTQPSQRASWLAARSVSSQLAQACPIVGDGSRKHDRVRSIEHAAGQRGPGSLPPPN